MRKLIQVITTSAALLVAVVALGVSRSPEVAPLAVAVFTLAIGRA
jgi:hypothetical protein